MSVAKSLSPEQVATIQGWAEDGDGLSDIQRKLNSELEVRVTYLETRFLLEDLGVELKPQEKESEEADDEPVAGDEVPAGEDVPEPAEGGVSVTIDQVQQPGALLSGKANFGGGNSLAWMVDQMGQLKIDPGISDFRPTSEQMMAFQRELQKAMQGGGF